MDYKYLYKISKEINNDIEKISKYEVLEVTLIQDKNDAVNKVEEEYSRKLKQCESDRHECEEKILNKFFLEYNEEKRDKIIKLAEKYSISQESIDYAKKISTNWNEDIITLDKVNCFLELQKSIDRFIKKENKNKNIFESIGGFFFGGD